MNNKKNYPHLPQEENRLRELCYEKLHAAYGESLSPEGKDRLDKELAAIAGSEMSGVMLMLHAWIERANLKQHELCPRGTLGASLVAWLCGLTPFDPLKTLLPFYPEFCFGFHWDKEMSVEFSVPTGKGEALFALLKEMEGIGDVIPVNENELREPRYIIPKGAEYDKSSQYFVLTLMESPHLRLLEQLADLTETDPKEIRFDDCEVFALFKNTDHPACIDISPFRLTAIGLSGVRSPDELEFYGNVNMDLHSFSDLVRVHSMAHSTDAWKNNQDRLVYEEGFPFAKLITCREDVYEYCRTHFGFSCEEAFIAAETVRKGRGFPYELREEDCPASMDCAEQHMPVWFHEFCVYVTYLWTRVDSYCRMAVAWRCAWYRLHYPLAFYQAYFHCVAKPQIREAVFAGKEAYQAAHVSAEETEHNVMFEESNVAPYDLDCAVADEMYFRGIDLSAPIDNNRHLKQP